MPTENTDDVQTLEDLRKRASELDIEGRSKMNRDQLEDAIHEAEHARDQDPEDLNVYEVRHEGHDVAAYSTVVAKDEAQARELIREALVADGHGLSHSNTHMEVRRKHPGDTPRSLVMEKAGVVLFDSGRVSSASAAGAR